MHEISRIQTALRAHLPWHGARLSFLALFLVTLFRVETVNLDRLASVFANRAQSESNHKRLTRFFRGFDIDLDEIARAIVGWSRIPQPWTLSLDRTTWSFGSVTFNILMLGIIHKGVAFPLMWTMLNKQGNSHSDERMDLLERFERVFPEVKIHCLTGDREFIGQDWFSFLMVPKALPFRLRVRQSDRITSRSGKSSWTGEQMFASLPVDEQRILTGKRWVWGRHVYVVATRLSDGELLIVATTHRPQTALADYRLRWGIETLFAALKSRGFNLESTHFCHPERLSKLVALLALAFCWAMLSGLWHHQRSPIPLKAHGRRAKSLFRCGCDFLRRTFCDFSLRRSEVNQAIQLLSPY
ncbi:MAG: IS4 family transposase [Cyanobacteria bacterium P01_F01_bin.33]